MSSTPRSRARSLRRGVAARRPGCAVGRETLAGGELRLRTAEARALTARPDREDDQHGVRIAAERVGELGSPSGHLEELSAPHDHDGDRTVGQVRITVLIALDLPRTA